MGLSKIRFDCYVLEPSTVVCERLVQGYCKLPYPGHPQGCPNFANKDGCPPAIGLWRDIFEPIARTSVCQWDFQTYRQMMQDRHPGWTDRQVRNPLYWQGYIRKRFYKWAWANAEPEEHVVLVPEAMGVNVTRMAENLDIALEWPPMVNLHLVALYGVYQCST